MTEQRNSFAVDGKMVADQRVLLSGLSPFLYSGFFAPTVRSVDAVFSDDSTRCSVSVLSREKDVFGIVCRFDVNCDVWHVKSRIDMEVRPFAGCFEPLPNFTCRHNGLAAKSWFSIAAGAGESGPVFRFAAAKAPASLWSVVCREFRNLAGKSWQIHDLPVVLTVAGEGFLRKAAVAPSRKYARMGNRAAVRSCGRRICIRNCSLVL